MSERTRVVPPLLPRSRGRLKVRPQPLDNSVSVLVLVFGRRWEGIMVVWGIKDEGCGVCLCLPLVKGANLDAGGCESWEELVVSIAWQKYG